MSIDQRGKTGSDKPMEVAQELGGHSVPFTAHRLSVRLKRSKSAAVLMLIDNISFGTAFGVREDMIDAHGAANDIENSSDVTIKRGGYDVWSGRTCHRANRCGRRAHRRRAGASFRKFTACRAMPRAARRLSHTSLPI